MTKEENTTQSIDLNHNTDERGSLSVVPTNTSINLVELEFAEGGLRAYLVVLACWLGLAVNFGLMNSIGAINPYITQHILLHNTSTEISWIFSVYNFIAFAGGIVSGFLFDKYGARSLFLTGDIFLSCGMIATASCTEYWQFMLAFGICVGIGSAALISPEVSAIGHFFKKKRGLAIGLAMTGASIGGTVWPLICRSLYGKIGFPWTIRTLGFIYLFMLTLAVLCVSDRRKEVQEALKRTQENEKQQSRAVVETNNVELVTTISKHSGIHKILEKVKEAIDFSLLKDATYDLLSAGLCMNEFSLIVTFTYIPSYAINKGFSESTALLTLTIANVTGIVGRYVPSLLSDKFGDFNMIVLTSLITTLSIFIIWVPFGQHLKAFYAFTAIYGVFSGGTLSLTPLCTSAITEPKNYGKAYGTAYLFCSFMILISLPIGMAITTSKAGYQALAIFCGVGCALSTLFFALARFRLTGPHLLVMV